MKKFDWSLALEKRGLEFVTAMIWFLAGISNLISYLGTDNHNSLVTSICAFLCVPCWVYIFYRRARRDGA